ncbi:iron-sulfur cluster-binding protein [Desulfocurvus sp. DL9XJH121]
MFANACQDVTVQSLTRFGKGGDDGNFFELALTHPGEEGSAWAGWRPGQFVMIRPKSFGLEPLMGRPFSIAGADEEGGVRVLFQVLGRGTAKLAELKPGDPVTMWGPLGNAFAMRPDERTLVLAGGIGIAPFFTYAERHGRPENLRLVFGHRPPIGCYGFDRLGGLCAAEAHRETCPQDLQDFIGLLGELVPQYCRDGLIVACGPMPFLRTIKTLADEHGGRAQLSLENRMACGVGACLGCVCEHDKDGPVSVCARGPVFWSDEISI